MRQILYLSLVLFTLVDLAGQQKDTVELISTEELQSDHSDILLPMDQSDNALLDSKGYQLKKLDNNLYCWSNNTEKQILCSGDVKIFKHESNKKTQSFCLACFQDNIISHADGCISLTNVLKN